MENIVKKYIYTSIYCNYRTALIFTVGPSLAVGECLTETMGFSSDKPSGNNFSTVEDLIN